MVNKGLWLAALLGSLILGGAAHAQNSVQETPPTSGGGVGPAAIRNFELRPDNQAAPADEQRPTIAPLSPPASTEQRQQPPASEPVVAIAPPPAPTADRTASPPPRRQVTEAPATGENALRPQDQTPAPSDSVGAFTTDPVTSAPLEADPAPLAVEAPPPSMTAQPALDPGGPASNWWLYLLFAGLVAGVGFVALRRKGRAEPAVAAPVGVLAPRSAAPPAPQPAPPVSRPWIDLTFQPIEAGTNDSHALVKFELMVRNTGNGEARDVRIDGRLFNAGAQQDGEIGAFFAETGAGGMPAPRPIAPQTELPYRGTVLLPREKVREVTVQDGRRLFIPMVAFNVSYKWGEAQAGQTSASYLVGSESDPPSDRMGAFRVDLGPRIYRRIGQREHRLRRRV